jgi:chemotaxis protein methyltransferase CheR
VSNPLIDLAALVRRESGIVLPEQQQGALSAALRRVAPELEADGFLTAANRGDPPARRLVDRLVDEVAVKETTFLRDRQQLDTIDWHGLCERAWLRGSSVVHVWSAGCATGEETYSLALLAAEALGVDNPPVQVLGTDISQTALDAAELGHYRERALREVDETRRLHYFTEHGVEYVVGPSLRRLVRFAQHNLVLDPIPLAGAAGFDLIVCRNVLIYFEGSTIDRLRTVFASALSPGGTLLLGAADALGGTPVPVPVANPAPVSAVQELRRPLGRTTESSRDELVHSALAAADAGRLDVARAHVSTLLRRDPIDADAHFVLGVVELEEGSPRAAIIALRRALYIDPDFGIAAFALACAHDTLGDDRSARRAYERALRTIDPDGDRHDALLQEVDLVNLTKACRLRLEPAA